MRILITTGIFEPESGGPATYTPQLAAKLVAAGVQVTVITYSNTPRLETDAAYPFKLIRVVRGDKIFNRIKFFFATLRHARDSDLIYTLDWFAAGLPVTLAAKLLGKPYMVRVGGDYLWEKYLESGAKPVTLADFYKRGIYVYYSRTATFRIIRFVLRDAARIVFNSDIQRALYLPCYGLDAVRTSIICNPVPRADIADIVRDAPTKEIVFFGRLIVMKNVDSLIRAFAQAALPAAYTLTIIGDGPQKDSLQRLITELHLESRVHMLPGMPKREVLQRVKDARACILPSWTDISPNQVYEAMVIGVPTIVTKENYLSIRDQLPEMIDPRSIDDVAGKLTMLADDVRYAAFVERFKSIHIDRDWDAAVREHMALFGKVRPSQKPGSEIHVLQIGADRSKRGILYPDSPAIERQKAYGEHFEALDIIGFSLEGDGRLAFKASPKVHVYPTNSHSRLFYGLDTISIARRLAKPDVISVQDPFETGLLGALMSWMMRVPLHVQVHTDFHSPEYRRHSTLNRARSIVAGFVLRRAARVRVVSERIKRSLQTELHIKAPITVLPIFTDIERFKNITPDEALKARFAAYTHKILVVARLEPEKDVALAIRSFAQSTPTDACLIILGSGSERRKLSALADSLTIVDSQTVGNRVFFEGEQDPAAYYALADLVLVPSQYEGYGLVIIEALAAGKPVLSTDVGVAREAGAIVADEKDFPAALKQWFKDGPRTTELKDYPYKDFEDYAQKYADDIAACAQ